VYRTVKTAECPAHQQDAGFLVILLLPASRMEDRMLLSSTFECYETARGHS